MRGGGSDSAGYAPRVGAGFGRKHNKQHSHATGACTLNSICPWHNMSHLRVTVGKKPGWETGKDKQNLNGGEQMDVDVEEKQDDEKNLKSISEVSVDMCTKSYNC